MQKGELSGVFEDHDQRFCRDAEPCAGEAQSPQIDMTAPFPFCPVQPAKSLTDNGSNEIKGEPRYKWEGREIDAVRERVDNADEVMLDERGGVTLRSPGNDGEPVKRKEQRCENQSVPRAHLFDDCWADHDCQRYDVGDVTLFQGRR